MANVCNLIYLIDTNNKIDTRNKLKSLNSKVGLLCIGSILSAIIDFLLDAEVKELENDICKMNERIKALEEKGEKKEE